VAKTASQQEKDRTFLARYGATILRGGIASIPAALYRFQATLRLTPQEVWFISAILSHKWDADMPYPSLKRMAEQTGVSRQQLHKYQRQLVDAGWLVVINRRTAQGGKDTNYYDFTPLFTTLEELLQQDQPPGQDRGRDVSDGLHPHVNLSLHGDVNASGHEIESVDEETIEELDPSNLRKVSPKNREKRGDGRDQESSTMNPLPIAGASLPSPAARESASGKPTELQRSEAAGMIPTESLHPRPASLPPEQPSSAAHGLAAIGDVLATRRRRSQRYDEDRQVIVDLLSDFRREFNDQATLKQSVSRCYNLMQRSGMEIGTFTSKMYEARAITKEHSASITSILADSRAISAKHKMAYWFSVLEDLCGLKPNNATQRDPSG
jgi:hypothetical protein